MGAIGAAILLLVLIKVFAPGSGARNGQVSALDGKPVSPAVLADLTQVPAAAFDRAGIAGAPLPYGGDRAVWKAGGKPVMLYIGAEYCPYCAASRWSLVAALARFGRWSGLEYMSSSATDMFPGTPTLTFAHASYSSPYLRFESVEETSNVLNPATNTYPLLQRLTAQQNALLHRYGVMPYVPARSAADIAIPFVDVANRFILNASLVNPAEMQGMTWAEIAAATRTGSGATGRAVLAAANVVAATVCAVDGGRPAAVCRAPGVRAAAARLPGPNAGKQPVGGGTA